MTNPGRGAAFLVALCTFPSLTTIVAPQSSSSWNIGPTKGQVVGASVGIAAVGVGIGVGVYFFLHRDHTLTGCTASGANGLLLRNEGDGQDYSLVGSVAGIRPDLRVRLSGRKKGRDAGGARTFLVEKLSKDWGPCHAPPATP
jgi:hypothetical protein